MRHFRLPLAFAALLAVARAAFDPAAFNAAVELYNRRQVAEAQAAFEALARVNPDNANIQFYLGRLALQRNDHEQAVPYLKKAVALVPNDARFHQRLGDAYGLAAQKAGMFSSIGFASKCKAEYEKAVELDPKNIDARLGLVSFYQQAPGFAGGSMEKAHAQAEEIKKLDASRGRAAIAGLYAAEKKNDLAFAEFEDALKDNPEDYSALYQFGRLAAITGERMDRGLEALRKCLTLTPPEGQHGQAAAHWRIGLILEKKGDQAGARAAYEAALRSDPKFSQAAESLKKL
ncbi:MAG: Tetratricopeptide repeat-containing protein [Lacunisphaera sp.]|nr:Tetratricopeptide repeat-containing protein [Lacunisphaera sp.]